MDTPKWWPKTKKEVEAYTKKMSWPYLITSAIASLLVCLAVFAIPYLVTGWLFVDIIIRSKTVPLLETFIFAFAMIQYMKHMGRFCFGEKKESGLYSVILAKVFHIPTGKLLEKLFEDMQRLTEEEFEEYAEEDE